MLTNSILEFIISGLIVWRIVHMLQVETGPLGIFARLQSLFAGLKPNQGGLKEMFFCFNCLSVYISIPFALFIAASMFEVVLYTLALSAFAIIINRILE